MAITANNTTLTFNDATTQTTSAVTAVNVSTGISSSGGKTPTLTNTGVTSVTAGTGITVSASTGGVTITNSSPGGAPSTAQVLSATAGATADAVGVYCVNSKAGAGTVNQNGTTSGGSLTNGMSGTWRNMGGGQLIENQQNSTLLLRIS